MPADGPHHRRVAVAEGNETERQSGNAAGHEAQQQGRLDRPPQPRQHGQRQRRGDDDDQLHRLRRRHEHQVKRRRDDGEAKAAGGLQQRRAERRRRQPGPGEDAHAAACRLSR